MNSERLLGVTVLPEYIQSETIDGVLDNLVHKCRATAVTTSPYLMEPADEQSGSREPPADAGAGGVRLLDRPLWGKRELWVRTAPSFVPQKKLYAGLRYQPAEPTQLTEKQGRLIHDFIRAAHARHLKVYLQVQAAIPPGYRVQFGGPQEDDKATLPTGRPPARSLDKNGSLASPHIVGYTQALIRDLCGQYPEIDGLRVDWPEYPPYFLDAMFLDFSAHAQAAARRLDFNFEQMRRDANQLYDHLHGSLTEAELKQWSAPDGGRFVLTRWLSEHPGIAHWLRFKAVLVEELLASFRRTMNEAGAERMELVPNAFPPPWSLVSGFNFSRAARHSTAASAKLYTMHWPVMLRFYGDQLAAANPHLDRAALVRALVSLLDLADDAGLPRLEDYKYPAPDEPHPVGPAAQARKIAQAQAEAGSMPVYSLSHGYGPIDDYRQRMEVAWRASPHGMWVNRYGYLSDEKLTILGQVVSKGE